ncbi:MAG: peptidoglycan-associated lipoprotein Pal [Gammaproteobacteria bacterium]|nr:peptidoglycan-associated lipoprotein Pal [Gammaproteobacteria bacterium]NND54370.1 peptidoglycan-associated lipoprotein Pal [Gammaproteobacteria bacterium]
MNSWKLLIPVCALVVTGCANQGGTSTGTDGGMDDGTGGVQTWPDDGTGGGSAVPIGDDRAAVVMNERVIYFELDSSDVDDASIEILKQHGRYLADNPAESVRLEGHADERGSREYNIGLGERRALSVRSILLVHGAGENQLTTVSYGEERPADTGSGESAWSMNRRVELVYGR